MADGDHLWNGGMFYCPRRRAAAPARRVEPGTPSRNRGAADAWDTPSRGAVVDKVWPKLTKIAIDYSVAEPAAEAGKLVVIPATLIGMTWATSPRSPSCTRVAASPISPFSEENARVLADKSTGVVISQSGRMISLIGVTDIVVVDTPDALLVTTTANAQRVKSVVDALSCPAATMCCEDRHFSQELCRSAHEIVSGVLRVRRHCVTFRPRPQFGRFSARNIR